jgi:mitochondrial fission protein ELM1
MARNYPTVSWISIALRNCMISRLLNFLLAPYRKFQAQRQLKKRIAELRKRDPFIY